MVCEKEMFTFLSLQQLLGENLHPDLQQFDFGGAKLSRRRVVYDRFTYFFSAVIVLGGIPLLVVPRRFPRQQRGPHGCLGPILEASFF